MSAYFQPHIFAVVSGVTLAVGLILIVYGRTTLQRLQIPEREDDSEGFERADRVLKRGMVLLRAGDIIGIVGGICVILTMLIYAGVVPGF